MIKIKQLYLPISSLLAMSASLSAIEEKPDAMKIKRCPSGHHVMRAPATAEEKAEAKTKKATLPKPTEPISDIQELNLEYNKDRDQSTGFYAMGTKLPLKAQTLEGVAGFDHLVTELKKIEPNMKIAIARSEKGMPYDLIFRDFDLDGKFDDEKASKMEVENRKNGSLCSLLRNDQSLKVTHQLPDNMQVIGDTKISYWLVVDEKGGTPKELRYSNKAFSTGEVTLDGVEYEIMIQDYSQDGLFNQKGKDKWFLKSKNTNIIREHGYIDEWFYGANGKAWTINVKDSTGLRVDIFEIEPNMTMREKDLAAGKVKVINSDEKAEVAKNPVVFETDLAKALEKAKNLGQPCFVKFEATWCSPCQILNKVVFNKQAIVDAAKNVVCVKIDGDKHPDIIKKYGVGSYPTMKMLDGDGNEISRFTGTRNIKTISAYLKNGGR